MNIFIIYDVKRKTPTGEWWRVATFRKVENANKFLEEQKNPNLFVSCDMATIPDLRMARD